VSRYTLKTFCGEREIERFDHRSSKLMREVLDHPRHYRAGQTGPFGEPMQHPDRFEIFDSQMERLFAGSIEETLKFTRTLR